MRLKIRCDGESKKKFEFLGESKQGLRCFNRWNLDVLQLHLIVKTWKNDVKVMLS